MRRRTNAVVGAAVGAAVALTVLSGCSDYNDKRGKGDAPVSDKQGDNTPAQVYNFPDGFGNLATKCVGHGNRAYVTTNDNAPSNIEIRPDSSCKDTP
ncbi:hypothetical protein [Streptomyces sp. NPDC050560]|uniref:hypothetical protein n=1 Tax=Streptomyces sp. NPDC050560 TaxID=3365630 RepID=UPI0037B53D08